MTAEIRALAPEMTEAYLDFFDARAFEEGSPYAPCYCNAFNLSAAGLAELGGEAARLGGGPEAWKTVLRASAEAMVRDGRVRGYLAFDGGLAIGWCNANDRMAYARVGEFNTDQLPADCAPADCGGPGEIKSVVCFAISPAWRGRGLATALLARVCADAERDGYAYVEGYPTEGAVPSLAFTGPAGLYAKAGFRACRREGRIIVMRKALRG